MRKGILGFVLFGKVFDVEGAGGVEDGDDHDADVGEDGQPHVRPIGTELIYNDKLYFQTGLKKKMAQQLLKNPKIEITAVKGDRWVRVQAEAVHDPDEDVQGAMLDAFPELKETYAVGDGNTACFYLKNAIATFCSFTESPYTVKF